MILPGTYTITFIGTIGDKNDSFSFDVVLVDPCLTATFTLAEWPLPDQTYILGEPQVDLPYSVTLG